MQYSQEELLGNPFHCPSCNRVYDGSDWFKSPEWYEIFVLWWNLSLQADILLRANETICVDQDVETWMLELMDFCDANTNMDVTVFYRLAMACYSPTPLSDANRLQITEALKQCRPIVELLWHRAISFPGRPKALAIGFERNHFFGRGSAPTRRGRPRSEAVAQRRGLVHQLSQQGLTPGAIETRLSELKSQGSLPPGIDLSVAIVKADLARHENNNVEHSNASEYLSPNNRLYSDEES